MRLFQFNSVTGSPLPITWNKQHSSQKNCLSFGKPSHRGQIVFPFIATPSRNRGFTLLELLVVLVILGLLAGYVAPKYFAQIGKSEVKTAKAQIVALEKALDQYRIDTGRYPNTEQGLAALNAKPADEPHWDGPYLKKAVPNDPWGKPYQYKMPGEHGEVDIFSFGRDGTSGGSGEDADIGNW
ncbi:MAG: type II secretion system major pseudopilin GspG [Rhizobium sp.]|nr:type II secretion system major pseudopilin GspG [Rhizobium sp.]